MTLEELTQTVEEIKRNQDTHRHTGLDALSIDVNALEPVPIANGGTGQVTSSAAINALLPSQTGNSGLFLRTNGTTSSWGSPYPTDYLDNGSQSSAVTFNTATANKQKVTLTGNVTISISNAVVGGVYLFTLIQDGTGSRTVTWFSGISWPGAIVPTLTTTASKADVFGFICVASNTYYGFIIGQNI